jgi:hypothetical protein
MHKRWLAHVAAEERRIEDKVALLGDLYGRPCFAGAVGGIVDGRPSTHVSFSGSGDIPIPVCRWHAASAVRLGWGAWKLPVSHDPKGGRE